MRVEKDEEVPADLLLVNAPKDIVFISTMNLDGETNLKDRELAIANITHESLKDLSGTVICDEPDPSLDKWEGKVSSLQIERDISCSIKNLLLRGVTLKNTEFAYGIVLYVGNQTKIMMNSKKPGAKVTKLMLLINKMLYSVFALQFCIILLFTGFSMMWQHKMAASATYLGLNGEMSFKKFVLQFFTY